MLLSEMTGDQLERRATFVARAEQSGWSARAWDAILEAGLPCAPECHAELETPSASLILDHHAGAGELHLLVASRRSAHFVRIALTVRDFDAALDAVFSHQSAISVAELDELVDAWRTSGTVRVEIDGSVYEGTSVSRAVGELAERERDIEGFDAWYDAALEALSCGDDATAAALLERVIAERPDFAEAWHNLGYAHARAGHADASRDAYAQAIARYDMASSEDDEDPYTWYWRASALALSGRAADAIESLGKAIALQPQYRSEAASESDFALLRGEPTFIALISG